MRGMIAILLACLLSLSAPLTTSVSATDLPLPVKAPPPIEAAPVAEFDVGLVIAGLAAAAIIAGIVVGTENHRPPPPVSPGANTGRLH